MLRDIISEQNVLSVLFIAVVIWLWHSYELHVVVVIIITITITITPVSHLVLLSIIWEYWYDLAIDSDVKHFIAGKYF